MNENRSSGGELAYIPKKTSVFASFSLSPHSFFGNGSHSSPKTPEPVKVLPSKPQAEIAIDPLLDDGLDHPDDLLFPIPALVAKLGTQDLKACAYEMLVASGAAIVSMRTSFKLSESPVAAKSSKTSRLRAALGLQPKDSESNEASAPLTPFEIIRKHTGFSDADDLRVRKVLSKSSWQGLKKADCNIVPLELLQNLNANDFPSEAEYHTWRRRQLMFLEESLVNHSKSTDSCVLKLKLLLKRMQNSRTESQWSELRMAVLTCLERTSGTDPNTSHVRWAQSYPLNFYIYSQLLETCLDNSLGNSTLIEELDDVVEVLKKVWPSLGITNNMHCACFAWMLFSQFVKTGKKHLSLLVGAAQMIEEIQESLAKMKEDMESFSKSEESLLQSVLPAMQSFAEKRLLAYHEAFPDGGRGIMGLLLGIAIRACEILSFQEVCNFPSRKKSVVNLTQEKAEIYIRSSVKGSFALLHERTTTKRRSFKGITSGIGGDGKAIPVLISLADEVSNLADLEVQKYTPVLKEWNMNAGGIAMATLHTCFKRELTQLISKSNALTFETAQILIASEKLEQKLLGIAVEECADSEDGGRPVIREMSPYETSSTIFLLLDSWIQECKFKLKEWIDRSFKNETWSIENRKESRHAVCAVDVMRFLNETFDTYLAFPLPHDDGSNSSTQSLLEMVDVMDSSIALFCKSIVSAAGSKDKLVPAFPPLTRYNKHAHPKSATTRAPKSSESTSNHGESKSSKYKIEIVRANTLDYTHGEIGAFSETIIKNWRNKSSSKSNSLSSLPPELNNMFSGVLVSCKKGVTSLLELAAYRVIYEEMKGVLLEGLYSGGVVDNRIEFVVRKLRSFLVGYVNIVSESIRNEALHQLLKALISGFIRVLLAGGSNRFYMASDAELIEADLHTIKDLFYDGGEGLPLDYVTEVIHPAEEIVKLFHMDTVSLITKYQSLTSSASTSSGSATKLRSSTSSNSASNKVWSPNDPDTVLRVLCYRADKKSSKFLKKILDLPKEPRKDWRP